MLILRISRLRSILHKTLTACCLAHLIVVEGLRLEVARRLDDGLTHGLFDTLFRLDNDARFYAIGCHRRLFLLACLPCMLDL